MRGLWRAQQDRRSNQGRLKVLSETTNAGFQWRFTAAMKGLSFYPTRSSLGTDTLQYSGSKTIVDPFTNETRRTSPACYPDVAVIHVHRADRFGNCQIDGNIAEDIEIAHAAKFVLVTAEEIIHDEVIQNDPALTKIPYFVVDAVVEAPYGSHPNQVPGLYSFDEAHWQEWLDASLTDEKVEEYLENMSTVVKIITSIWRKLADYALLRHAEKVEKKLAPYPKVARRRG